MRRKKNMQVGADPEHGIKDERGRNVPAWKWFEKEATTLFESYRRDGWSVEFNPYPSFCRALMFNSYQRAVEKAEKRLPKGFRFHANPTYKIHKEDLKKAPEDALTTGCNPSLNIYTLEEGVPDLDFKTHPFRYNGGHLHFSTYWPFGLEEAKVAVRLLDRTIGMYCAYVFNNSGEFKRRKYYGRAGECRLKGYLPRYGPNGALPGFEYRVPSGAIFNFMPFAQMLQGVVRTFVSQGVIRTLIQERFANRTTTDAEVQHAINTGEGAKELLIETSLANMDVLDAVKEKGVLSKFTSHKFRDPSGEHKEHHTGWLEWLSHWGIQAPGYNKRGQVGPRFDIINNRAIQGFMKEMSGVPRPTSLPEAA
jgi:hypothetical protein